MVIISGDLINCSYFDFIVNESYGSTYKNDICINKNNENINGQYFKYVNDVYNISNINIKDFISIDDITIKRQEGTQKVTLYFGYIYSVPSLNTVTFTVSSYDEHGNSTNVPEDTSIQINYSYVYKQRKLSATINVIILTNNDSASKTIFRYWCI